MAEPIEIDVWQGEIAELEVDALVVGANESLFMTAGPAASVRRNGGEPIERAAVDQGPMRPGGGRGTDGGHPRGRLRHSRRRPSATIGFAIATLVAAIRSALAFAEPLQLRRVAFSLIGTEHGVFSAAEAAAVLVPAVIEAARSTPVESVVLAASHASEVKALSDALRAARAGATVS